MYILIYMPILHYKELTEFPTIIKDNNKALYDRKNTILNLQPKLADVTKDRDELRNDHFY